MEKKNDLLEQHKLKNKQAIVEGIIKKAERGEELTQDEKLIYSTAQKVSKEEKSWFVRNAWFIAVVIAIFIFRMCSELSK